MKLRRVVKRIPVGSGMATVALWWSGAEIQIPTDYAERLDCGHMRMVRLKTCGTMSGHTVAVGGAMRIAMQAGKPFAPIMLRPRARLCSGCVRA
jgi:hypothetical protein